MPASAGRRSHDQVRRLQEEYSQAEAMGAVWSDGLPEVLEETDQGFHRDDEEGVMDKERIAKARGWTQRQHDASAKNTTYRGLFPTPAKDIEKSEESFRVTADLLALLEEAQIKAGSLRPEVASFAALMEAELRKHDDRPGWKGEDPHWLLARLNEEVIELANALLDHSKSLPHEAADVANFAMMIADVCGGLKAEQIEAGDEPPASTYGLNVAIYPPHIAKALGKLRDESSPGLHDADERERVRSLLEDVCGDCIHEGRPLVSDEVIDSILAQPKPTVARGLSYHVWKDGVWLGEIDGDDSSELSDRIFIAHVQSHLKPGQEVVCKICNRTAKEICGITIEEEKNG